MIMYNMIYHNRYHIEFENLISISKNGCKTQFI